LGRSRHFPALPVGLPLAFLEASHMESSIEVIDEVLVEVALVLWSSISPKDRALVGWKIWRIERVCELAPTIPIMK
jgi:hypothetical protein